MRDQTGDDDSTEAVRIGLSVERRPGRRLPIDRDAGRRRAQGPAPFSQAMLHARLALLRPRLFRLRRAEADQE